MKIRLESIQPDPNSSFRLLRNPGLNDLYYWHFHPEFELVYITNADGPRHVGSHISEYHGSDLVFIGSDIPHLNFDYGVKTESEKVVLHIQPAFRSMVFQEIPEFDSIYTLFEKSQHGIAFHGEIKDVIGTRLLAFHTKNPFDQFLELLQIFQLLANSNEYELLHQLPYINRSAKKERERINLVYAFVDEHFHKKLLIDEVAKICGLTKSAFCRYFKNVTGNTFITFLHQYRVSQAKRIIQQGGTLSEACYESGFESLSYFNRIFKKVSGENPSAYRMRTQVIIPNN